MNWDDQIYIYIIYIYDYKGCSPYLVTSLYSHDTILVFVDY